MRAAPFDTNGADIFQALHNKVLTKSSQYWDNGRLISGYFGKRGLALAVTGSIMFLNYYGQNVDVEIKFFDGTKRTFKLYRDTNNTMRISANIKDCESIKFTDTHGINNSSTIKVGNYMDADTIITIAYASNELSFYNNTTETRTIRLQNRDLYCSTTVGDYEKNIQSNYNMFGYSTFLNHGLVTMSFNQPPAKARVSCDLLFIGLQIGAITVKDWTGAVDRVQMFYKGNLIVDRMKDIGFAVNISTLIAGDDTILMVCYAGSISSSVEFKFNIREVALTINVVNGDEAVIYDGVKMSYRPIQAKYSGSFCNVTETQLDNLIDPASSDQYISFALVNVANAPICGAIPSDPIPGDPTPQDPTYNYFTIANLAGSVDKISVNGVSYEEESPNVKIGGNLANISVYVGGYIQSLSMYVNDGDSVVIVNALSNSVLYNGTVSYQSFSVVDGDTYCPVSYEDFLEQTTGLVSTQIIGMKVTDTTRLTVKCEDVSIVPVEESPEWTVWNYSGCSVLLNGSGRSAKEAQPMKVKGTSITLSLGKESIKLVEKVSYLIYTGGKLEYLTDIDGIAINQNGDYCTVSGKAKGVIGISGQKSIEKVRTDCAFVPEYLRSKISIPWKWIIILVVVLISIAVAVGYFYYEKKK